MKIEVEYVLLPRRSVERRLVEWGILVDGGVADPFTLQAEFSTIFRLHTIFSSDILLNM